MGRKLNKQTLKELEEAVGKVNATNFVLRIFAGECEYCGRIKGVNTDD